MKLTLGILVMLAGAFLLVGGSLAVVVVDTTPPEYKSVYPDAAATYASVKYLEIYVRDLGSGIKSVRCSIQSVWYTLAYSSLSGDWEIWQLPDASFTDITTGGTYSIAWEVTNKADLKASWSGSFVIYTGLAGNWYINGILVTAPTQILYSSTTTVSFKFVKTAGIEDNKVFCYVYTGSSATGTPLLTLTLTATSTWTGSYTFTPGTYTLTLAAKDGTQSVIMSVVGLDIPGLPTFLQLPFNLLQIAGVSLIAIGYVMHKKQVKIL